MVRHYDTRNSASWHIGKLPREARGQKVLDFPRRQWFGDDSLGADYV